MGVCVCHGGVCVCVCPRMVFPMQVNKLPFESMLSFRLLGCKHGRGQEGLRWAVLPLCSSRCTQTDAYHNTCWLHVPSPVIHTALTVSEASHKV